MSPGWPRQSAGRWWEVPPDHPSGAKTRLQQINVDNMIIPNILEYMCMYVCNVCVHIYIYIHIYTYMYTYMYMYMFMFIHIYIYIRMVGKCHQQRVVKYHQPTRLLKNSHLWFIYGSWCWINRPLFWNHISMFENIIGGFLKWKYPKMDGL